MDSQVDEIKEKLNIVDVVQEYVPSLKRSGRNFFGLCPFHQEKTPSFSVNPELNIFKCFGCGEGGDILTFIEKIEGVDFSKALELAAKKAGVTLKKFDTPQARKFREKKQRALEAHRLAAEYYHYILTEHETGKVGLSYATKARKIEIEQIEKFKLGYAPKNFNNLVKFLTKKGFKEAELVEFGLLARKGRNTYDKFRGRLMHPIFSMQGDVVGFSGRIIDKEDKGPKYLNSPETVIYKKKNLVYGGYQAKEAMRQAGFVVLVEGNIDIISSHRAGIANIVCPLGTALTDEQLKLLKRYVEEIYFAFDTDQAGKKALLRSLEMAEKQGFAAKAVDLGEFGDSDDLICSDGGVRLWKQRVKSAEEIPEFIIEKFKEDYDLNNASQKQKYIRSCLPFIAKLRDEIKIDHYLQTLEIVTGTKYDVLKKLLDKQQQNSQVYEQGSERNTDTDAAIEKPQEYIPQIHISKPLARLINMVCIFEDKLSDKEKVQLKDLYKKPLEEFGEKFKIEIVLLDMAFGKKFGEKNKDLNSLKDINLQKEIEQILKRSDITIPQILQSDGKSLIKDMIKNWMKSLINEYFHELERQAKQMDRLETQAAQAGNEDGLGSKREENNTKHIEHMQKVSLLKRKFDKTKS